VPTRAGPIWVSASHGKTLIVIRIGPGWFASTAQVIACIEPRTIAKTIPAPNLGVVH
jgi:hypothetical protein